MKLRYFLVLCILIVSANQIFSQEEADFDAKLYPSNKYKIYDDSIISNNMYIKLIVVEPLNKNFPKRLWIDMLEINYYKKNSVDNDKIRYEKPFFLGLIDAQNSIYLPKFQPFKDNLIFVIFSKNKKNRFTMILSKYEFSGTPGCDFSVSSDSTKIYIKSDDNFYTMIDYSTLVVKGDSVNLPKTIGLSKLPNNVSIVFYEFNDSEKLK